MNMSIIIKYRFFLAILICFASISFANVKRESCEDFLDVSIKGIKLNFNSELQTITKNNLARAIDKTNNAIGRRSDLIDKNSISNSIFRLDGIGLYRMGGDDINCFVGIDNDQSKVLIIDSKNGESKNFEICGPVIKRKKNFPWFKISWECINLWSYSCSKVKTYGEFGHNREQFNVPTSLVSDGGDQLSVPVNLWITDMYNNRIVHLSYSVDGKMSWVNSIGNFDKPVDLAYKKDSETPVVYVACQGGYIVRIPVTDTDVEHFQKVDGNLVETGYQIDGNSSFENPTGICLNQTSDIDGWNNSITYVYVVDAGKEKIFRFIESGAELQFVNSVSLPKLDKKRKHLGIRSDRFGTLYVFDKSANKVLVYSPSLEKINEFGSYGEHSSTLIKFNFPGTGFITGDNLFVVDNWSDNSGMQRFNIGGIDINSASVDYALKTATIISDNAFDKCSYSIDGCIPKDINGLQYSGSFTLDLSNDLEGLSLGRHTITITLQSAYSVTGNVKTCTKTVPFIVDPDAARKPRNIKINTIGRRVDINWDKPLITSNLLGYNVYVNNSVVSSCDINAQSFSWYASRLQAGQTLEIKIDAIYDENVDFTSLSNFSVVGNGLEHTGTGTATAIASQQLKSGDISSMPIGARWHVGFQLPDNITDMFAQKVLTLGPMNINLEKFNGQMVIRVTGSGINELREIRGGDRVEFDVVKQSTTITEIRSNIRRENVNSIVSHGAILVANLPYSISYHSDTKGLILKNCTIGLENTLSSGFSVTLRPAGNVLVDGSVITLDNAVVTAFNGDNLILSDAEQTLSVPLNEKPIIDNNVTPVNFSITGNSAIINYLCPNSLITPNMSEVQSTISMSGVILKSLSPMSIFCGSTQLTNSLISFTLQNSVVDAPEIKLINSSATMPIPTSGSVALNLQSNTICMDGTDGFLTLSNFQGLSLVMSDNLVYQKDPSMCFSFSDTYLCHKANMTNNAFLLANYCTGSENRICTPLSNVFSIPFTEYDKLDENYCVTSLFSKAVIKNADGGIENVIGCFKTINGKLINYLVTPELKFHPDLFNRSSPYASYKVYYVPLENRSILNTSLGCNGKIYFSSSDVHSVLRNSYVSKEVFPGDIINAYGIDSYGFQTPNYILSFPSNVVFDEQDISKFFGAKYGNDGWFIGKTSTDAASGSLSWNVESLPKMYGGSQEGYFTYRTESFFEPLPDVSGAEVFTFNYKKQYLDQIFSLTFLDDQGIAHIIQNTPLSEGTRGWYLSSDANSLDWQQATIIIKDEINVPESQLPMSGKLMQLTVHHQSTSANSSVPTFMLFDKLVFRSQNSTVFNEQDPSDFSGKGGSDGWNGLISTDAFRGLKSFQISIPQGCTYSTDFWTGLQSNPVIIDLPSTFNKRKFTFAYKKSDVNSIAGIKLYFTNSETGTESVFEVSEQSVPENLNSNGWSIPCQNDTRWHQVFIDLFSVKGPGNTLFPVSDPRPFGKLSKIELCVKGIGGSTVLFDEIKFVQDFYQQTVNYESYSVSPEYSEDVNFIDWKINSLSKVNKNTIISYGTSNNLTIEENYNSEDSKTENETMSSPLEIQKDISINGTEFNNTYICWNEKGASSGAITVNIQCSDGKNYPLSFSPANYNLVNSRGICSKKALSDITESRYSYNLVNTFNEYYPELVSASIQPVGLTSLKVQYKLINPMNWYSRFDYKQIEFIQSDAIPSVVKVNFPIEDGSYGVIVPIIIEGNKEIASVKVVAKHDEDILKQWQWNNIEKGLTTVSKEIDIRQIADLYSNLTFEIIVTDIFGKTNTIERNAIIDKSIPTISLFEPNDQLNYNCRIPIRVISDISLGAITYRIKDLNGILLKEGISFCSSGTLQYYDSIEIDGSYPQNVIVSVFGTAVNGQQSTIITRNIRINPPIVAIGVGVVKNPTITWNSEHFEATICGASINSSSYRDNLVFGATEIKGNFEATICIRKTVSLTQNAKAGLMARSSFNTDAVSDFIYISKAGVYTQYRQSAGQSNSTSLIRPFYDGDVWFKLKRIGPDLFYYYSLNGVTFSKVQVRNVGTLPLFVGPTYTSENGSISGCVTVSNVSIETFSDAMNQITLGVKDQNRLRPSVIQNGKRDYLEDYSTRNNGEQIKLNGLIFQVGIGGMAQANGSPSYLLYNLNSEARRLQISKILRLTGIGGRQDNGNPVTMKIKASNSDMISTTPDWLNSTGQVYEMWTISTNESPKIIDLDLTNVVWLGLFISSNPADTSSHGTWGNLKIQSIQAEGIAPKIITQPSNITKKINECALFSVNAKGSLPMQYQWQKNYMAIAGATSSSYITPPLSKRDSGAVYRCVISNANGFETSSNAVLTVKDSSSGSISEYSLVTKTSLDIRDRVKIDASKVLSNNNIFIGCDDTISKNIYAAGNVTIRDRTKVIGDVYAGGTVILGNSSVVTGSIYGGYVVPTVDIESHEVTSGQKDTVIANNSILNFIPGKYANLHVFSNSTINLVPGIYDFSSIIFECDVKVIFKLNGSEKTTINVSGEIRFGDRCNVQIVGTGVKDNIKWYSNFSNTINIYPNSNFIGQLIVPFGEVHLFSQSTINGICHANRMVIEPSAKLNY